MEESPGPRRNPGNRKNKAAYRKPQRNLFSTVAVVIGLLVLVLVVAVGAVSFKEKINTYNKRIEELQAQIRQEQERAEQIEEFRKYTQTKGYVEEVAQDILGLVYDGEILFKQE